MSTTLNDNDDYPAVARPREPDAHGQAAMVMVESLIHALIERSVITTAEAIEIVDAAADVAAAIADDLGDRPTRTPSPHSLLAAISTSLRHDVQGNGRSNGSGLPDQ